jgi:hypothetical protein
MDKCFQYLPEPSEIEEKIILIDQISEVTLINQEDSSNGDRQYIIGQKMEDVI